MPISKLRATALVDVCLSGCATLSGTYVVTATDADGKEIAKNVRMMADGTGIYTARNALCATKPGAVVHIKDSQTGRELESESPYKCNGGYCKKYPQARVCVP